MKEDKYSKLKNLFSCYFHQDMDLEYSDVESALKAYVMENSNDSISLALLGICELRKENYDEKYLNEFICRKLGSSYYYQADNMTGKQWLNYVDNTIKKYLAEKQRVRPEGPEEGTHNKIS